MRYILFLIFSLIGVFSFSQHTVTSFSPASATSSVTVTIYGTNFNGSPAVSQVLFGGVPASSFKVLNPTTIEAIVSGGGATGDVSVIMGSTTVSRGGFIFYPPVPSASWPFSYLLKPTCSSPNTMPPNAGSCTKWPKVNNGEWGEPTTWNDNKLPSNMDVVCIPENIRIIVKNPVYSAESVCPSINPAASPRLFIFVCGTIDFDASGKLYLGCRSAIQIWPGGKVLSANGNSELIQIGTKVLWRDNNPDLAGPYYLNDGCLASGCIGPGVLPASFGSLKATQNKPSTVDLKWKTTYEYQSSQFVIERSSNQNNWESIGVVASKGNGRVETDYSFTDLNPKDGINYYRLRQIDMDGSFSFSDVVKVNAIQKQNIYMYPNPAKGKTVIYAKSGIHTGSTISLYKQDGAVLENTNIRAGNLFELDLSKYQNGVYVVRIVDSNGSVIFSQPLIKQ